MFCLIFCVSIGPCGLLLAAEMNTEVKKLNLIRTDGRIKKTNTENKTIVLLEVTLIILQHFLQCWEQFNSDIKYSVTLSSSNHDKMPDLTLSFMKPVWFHVTLSGRNWRHANMVLSGGLCHNNNHQHYTINTNTYTFPNTHIVKFQ